MGKKFHDIRNTKKAIPYGSRKGLGPFKPRPKKKAAQGVTGTQSGKEDPVKDVQESFSIIPDKRR